MNYDPQKHNRRSLRLKGYDYASPGLYFVTICTHNQLCLFGQVTNGTMVLNKWGKIARDEWRRTASIRDNVALDAFVVMPNHVHGIIQIIDTDNNVVVGAYRDTPLLRNIDPDQQPEFRSPSKTVGAIVRGYKSAVTTRINKKRNTAGRKVWQRNYHDHIIRDRESLERIRYYIRNNPSQWEKDQHHPPHG
jgi:REP element-mobilizing transposase RayT